MFYDLLIKKAKEDEIIKFVVGGVIINDKNEILILTRKTNDFMGGIDELPSGNIEENEGIYDALKREIKEETNLDLEKVCSYINSFDYLSSSGKKARQFNFVVKVKETKNIKLTEHDNYKWESIDEIRNNNKITQEVKYVIETCNYNIMEERFKSVVCTDLLIKKIIDNEVYILLMKRQNTGYNDGEYELPGGHLESNEDLYDSMIREAKEELLINLKREEIKIIYLMHHYNGERLNFIFEVDGTNLNPIIGEKDKCSELKWVKINDLPNETTNKVKLIINDIINNINYNKL